MSELTDGLEEMGDDPVAEGSPLMPGWFTERMMTDSWSFGLMMSNGTTIGIQDIWKVWQAADGTLWLDVTLLSGDYENVWVAPTSRTSASINASHVMAAFELADT